MTGSWLLPALLGLPLCGALLIMLLPREEAGLCRAVGLGFSLLTFGLSLGIFGYFESANAQFQLVIDLPWIDGLGAHFKLGIDGISLWLVVLTTFTMPIVLLSSYSSIHKREREFVALMLVLELGMLGAFVSLDLFLFYIFWELMLIPMYLLIGIWGGNRRIYASIKFVIYTMVGSLLMLAAIFYVYVVHAEVAGFYTTDLEAVQRVLLSRDAQVWCFAAFALAFAIKVPLFPLHTWLPDAHVQAPTTGSVVLAGVLLKFGVYGFLRFAVPMFPYGTSVVAPYLAILAVAGIIYGALVAFAQDDVKKLVAYSSVSHLGFCILGLFSMTARGIEGSIFAMLSHGLTTGGLFLAIGVLYERRHTRRMAEYGGLWAQMPVFAGVFLICTLGSAGLPGLSGFIGEFLTIFGTFTTSAAYLPAPRLLGALAATGVILGAVYLLFMFQKLMFGPITRDANRGLRDLSGREMVVFAPLVVMIFVMGVAPQPFLKTMEPSVERFIRFHQFGLDESLKAVGPADVPRLRGGASEYPSELDNVPAPSEGEAEEPAGPAEARRDRQGAQPAGEAAAVDATNPLDAADRRVARAQVRE
ncbi:complex I subunit 4 family protein [Haliangium ochraceum]|uniref:Proton-translocating NADH-quinone oxidoreductase, chain M n=1 Tax=Haliangium ochraceum (strain DSM 14365 / JCM 11303 / SMP-2) TaxID=502025 RepID=D0LZ06_HALO1|nr:NADH-quinone oxidoreductase subunit M [Haliangium ochraceum]ACY14476.1 proton-translocating NADH-quinone oxidoreductase, chain M [Haliangium ochraceum DSM 14365]